MLASRRLVDDGQATDRLQHWQKALWDKFQRSHQYPLETALHGAGTIDQDVAGFSDGFMSELEAKKLIRFSYIQCHEAHGTHNPNGMGTVVLVGSGGFQPP